MNQILKLTQLLLCTTILTMIACILIATQQVQINHLKQTLNESQESNYNFDKAVVDRLNKSQ
jgi:hypothetical protein